MQALDTLFIQPTNHSYIHACIYPSQAKIQTISKHCKQARKEASKQKHSVTAQPARTPLTSSACLAKYASASSFCAFFCLRSAAMALRLLKALLTCTEGTADLHRRTTQVQHACTAHHPRRTQQDDNT